MLNIKNIVLFSVILFSFSCEDLKQLSEQVKDIKNDQSLIMQRQTEIMKQLALLDNKISKSNKPNNKPNNNDKKKGPNPDFVHNIDIVVFF